MAKQKISLSHPQREAFLALRSAHRFEVIRCADAVETLAGDSESIPVRKQAYEMIQTLARLGALTYNSTSEQVQVLDVRLEEERVSPESSANPTAQAEPPPLTLADFIERLTLARIRAVWEMIGLHVSSKDGRLPARLAEQVILRLKKGYPEGANVLTTPEQVRQLIYHLRDVAFLESTEARGVYRITPEGLDLVATIERKTRKEYQPNLPSPQNAPESGEPTQ